MTRCGRRLYDGTSSCCRPAGHAGPHEKWMDLGDLSALEYRWYDCPRCGQTCSGGAFRMWGYCADCWCLQENRTRRVEDAR